MKNICSYLTHRLACIFLGLAGLLAVERAPAASHTWAGVGLSGFWSLPANWQANNPPSAAEAPPVIIVFPPGASRLNNTNNLGGLVIDQLNFTGAGYTINGSDVGTNLTFKGGAASFTVSGANNVLASTLNLTLSNSVPFSITGDLTVYSKLLGSGGFSLGGNGGALTLNSIGDNQFTGAVVVTNGTLYLHNGFPLFSTWVPAIAVPGALTVGGTNMALSPTVISLADSELAANCPLTLNPDGYFMLNGHSNELGSVMMTGGSFYGGSVTNATIGTLKLQGGITAAYTPFINPSLGANLNLGGVTRTIDVASNVVLNLSGVIDDGLVSRGTAGIIKTSPGTLNLSGANTYNGVTTVSAGILALYNSSALGATKLGTTVASGAQLYLTGGLNIGAEPLTLNGNGPNGGGALLVALANTWNGQVTLASDSTVNTVNSTGQITFDGVLTGGGGVTKAGSGTATFFADFADTYAGATYVTGGTLKLYCGTSVSPQVAVPGYLEIASGTTNATVQLLGSAQLSATAALQIDSGGVLDLNNNSATCGPLVFNAAFNVLASPLLQTGTGTLTLNGDVSGLSGSATGIISLGGASRQFTLNGGYLFCYATIIGGGGSAGIINNGSGGIVLAVANTYSGQTVINSGNLEAWNNNSFGTGAGGVVVNGYGQLSLGYFGPYAVTISNVSLTLNSGQALGAGALISQGSNNWVGPISVESDSLTSCPSNSVLNINGPISGPGNLFVGGSYNYDGTTIFSGASDNTFAGTLTVDGLHTLELNKSGGATAVPGALVIGNDTDPQSSAIVQLEGNNQIANSAVVTVKPSGDFSLLGFSETIGPLVLSGSIYGWGLLTLNGNVTNDDAYGLGQLYCPLSLGGQTRVFNIIDSGMLVGGSISDGGGSAGITKTGYQDLQLAASNSFSGTLTINAGDLDATDNHALGAVAGGVVLNEGAGLLLGNLQITNKLLTVNSTSEADLIYYGTNLWTGPVTLNGPLFCPNYSATTDQLTFSNVISGPGGLTMEGNGRCTFSGTQANTFTGLTWVSSGVLNLQKTAGHAAVAGSLDIGDAFDPALTAQVVLSADEQIKTSPGNVIQVNNSGYLNLNAHTETVPKLNLWDGALVDSGSGGLLILNSNVVMDATTVFIPNINGNLSLGGTNRVFIFNLNTTLSSDTALTINASINDGGNAAGFTSRNGVLSLEASNSFAGPLIVDGGNVTAHHSLAFGSTAAGVVLTNGAYLVTYVSITNESLTTTGAAACGVASAGSNYWTGPIQLLADTAFNAASSSYAFMVTAPISGPANLFPAGLGTVGFAGSAVNLLTGTIHSTVNVLELARIGSTAVYGPLQIAGGTVRWKTSDEILDSSSVTVTAPGVADLNSFNETIGDFSGNGTVLLGSGRLTVGGANLTNTFSGTINGNALCEFDKNAGNTLILSGANSYSGNTFVKGGTLLANGAPAAADVYVYPGGTLGGTGTIGNLYDLGGNVSPGNGAGTLNCGYATFNAGSTLFVSLSGTNLTTGYNQLNATGVVTLNSGVNLSLTKTFAGAAGNQFIIVNNDLADAVAGTFTGLTNGATFIAGNTSFRINYNGNTGNDIVLTQLTAGGSSQMGGIARLGNGSVQFSGTGVPGLAYTVQANTNLATATWINIGTTNASAAGGLQFNDPNAAAFKQRFYRFSYP